MLKKYLSGRNIIISLFLTVAVLCAGYLSQSNPVSAEADVEKTQPAATAVLPNLSGEEAKEYLKEQGLYESLGEAMKMARYSINPSAASKDENGAQEFAAKNARQAFSTVFSEDGVKLFSEAKNNKWQIEMNLESYGYGDDLAQVEPTKSEVQKNKSRIEITKSAIQNPTSKIVEWYENTPDGLEQGWTLAEKPSEQTDESLKLVLKVDSNLKAKLAADKQAVDFVRGKNEPVVRYDKLKSWDADGKELATRMELNNNTLAIVVDDADAKYPITVDPFFTQTKKIVASDPGASDLFGVSVSISGDTAIVGAFLDDNLLVNSNQGSAYIFERNTSGVNMWGQVKKLVASDAATNDQFGISVSISGDTVIVGALLDDAPLNNSGSAYIYERNTGGANNWGQLQKIIASDRAQQDQFGVSVSISGDTAIVGASLKDVAAPPRPDRSAAKDSLNDSKTSNEAVLVGADQGAMYIFNAVAAPLAASVSVSGRVSVGKGAGLTNAVVMLTDQNGETRTARTSSFGYYQFDDVEVGQSYTMTVRARRYFFSPQVIFVNEEIEDLNFTAN